MSKTNFSKVEKSLEEGLLKMSASNLLEQADRSKVLNKESLPKLELRVIFLQKIEKELKKLNKQDKQVYKKLDFSKDIIKKFIDNPSLLTGDDWIKLKEIKERIEIYKKNLSAQLPTVSDEDLVNSERHKHVNIRFNVSKKWLPLD